MMGLVKLILNYNIIILGRKYEAIQLIDLGPDSQKIFSVLSSNYCNFLVSRIFSMYFFLKYIVTLFYKKLRIKIVVFAS